MGASRKKIREWVKNIVCIDTEFQIAEARRIYLETDCNMNETIRQLQAVGTGADRKKVKEWVADIECEDYQKDLKYILHLY